MINNKLDLENITILNNYQETGTVIYTGDGIATITGLSNVQTGELLLIQPNNVASLPVSTLLNRITRGLHLIELLKQGRYKPVSLEHQILLFFGVMNGAFDTIKISHIRKLERFIRGTTCRFPYNAFLNSIELFDSLNAYRANYENNLSWLVVAIHKSSGNEDYLQVNRITNFSMLPVKDRRNGLKKENNPIRNLYTGRRCFSSSTFKKPDPKKELNPIILPQFALTSIVYAFILNSLLFALLIRGKFLIAVGIVVGGLFISFFYYFFFKNKARISEFLLHMRRVIALQPQTLSGIITKMRLASLTWWILVVHFLFYTMGGYIFWSASTSFGIFFSIYTYTELNFIPEEIFILLSIMNIGVIALLTCQFFFWKEKKYPFLYTLLEKKIVLLVIQNSILASGVWSRFLKPVGSAALAGYAYLLGSGASQDRTNAKMYDSACDVAKSQGKPAPDPRDFQRKGPSWEVDVNLWEMRGKVNRKQ